MRTSIVFLALAVLTVGAALLLGISTAGRRAAARGITPPAHALALCAAVFAALIGIHLALANSGVLGRFDRLPPPFAGFVLFNLIVAVTLALSPLGTLLVHEISLAALVGFHGFRLLAEALLYTAYHEGLAPVQMTFEGRNFDVVTALTAIALAPLLRRRTHRGLTIAWSAMGITLLMVVMGIAITSMPGPLRHFMNEPSNLWVTTVPYVLLPGVLVPAALAGHILVLRKVRWLSVSSPASRG